MGSAMAMRLATARREAYIRGYDDDVIVDDGRPLVRPRSVHGDCVQTH